MNNKQFRALEDHLASSLKKALNNKPIDELKKLDWLSLNPDFHIEKSCQSRQAA